MRGKSALRLDPRLGRMSHSVRSDMDGMGASLVPNSGEKEGDASSLSFFSSKVLGTDVASEPPKEAASQESPISQDSKSTTKSFPLKINVGRSGNSISSTE